MSEQKPSLHRESRMTRDGQWVWRWVSDWQYEDDSTDMVSFTLDGREYVVAPSRKQGADTG